MADWRICDARDIVGVGLAVGAGLGVTAGGGVGVVVGSDVGKGAVVGADVGAGVAVRISSSQASPATTTPTSRRTHMCFIPPPYHTPPSLPPCYNQPVTTADSLLEGLNPPQREAVETIDGPLLILAGPGSGKTRVITTRIAYLMRVVGVYPSRMMAVTFTNKASKEMRERVFDLVGEDTERLTMGTFHSICVRILRTGGEPIGLDRNLVIYDEDDKASIIKEAMKDLNIDPRNFPPRTIMSSISASKSQMIDAESHRLHVHSYFDEVVGRVFQRYQAILEENNGVDFDDLLLKAVQLFDRSPDTLERYANRYRYLLIDEFQDTNVVQYRLARQMASQHGNICVVGDPDQSIYSWRHADIRNILSFEKDFPKAKVIYLEQNYRSTQTILESAHFVIAANRQRKEKSLWTDNGQGVPITMSEAYNEQDEAQTVAKEIERLMRDNDLDLGDIAVMYRTNAQSRVLEESFLRYGISYRLVGGTRFYERREVKDIVAYLRLVHNPYDSVSLRRVINVPKRGIGQKTVDGLMIWAQQLGMPPYTALQLLAHPPEEGFRGVEPPFASGARRTLVAFLIMLDELIEVGKGSDVVHLISMVAERTGYKDYLLESDDRGEDRWENIMELRSVAAEYRGLEPDESLTALLDGVALVSDTDELDGKANAVTLITLHQAKGLEYPVVFLVGMEEGLLPHRRSIDDPDQMEEERRLCYVGMTRAKERLYLLRAFRRNMMGASNVNPASRFLEAIPQGLTANFSKTPKGYQTRADDLWWSPPQPRAYAGPEYSAGDRVKHGAFGEGIVVSCGESGDEQVVTVAFKGAHGIKKLLLSYAPLEKLN